jgi:WD40 repeat protein
LAVSFQRPIVEIWDTNLSLKVRQFIGHTSRVQAMVELNDNMTIATGAYDSNIKIWNHTNGHLRKNLTGHLKVINGLVVLKNDVLASCSDDWTINIWNITNCEIISSEDFFYNVNFIILVKSDLLAIEVVGSISFWNVTSWIEMKIF